MIGFSLVGAVTTLLVNKALTPSMIQKVENMPIFEVPQVPNKGETKAPIIRLEDPETGFFCSGTVISNDLVLTAAHCLIKNNILKGQIGMRKDTFHVVSSDQERLTVEVTAAALNQRSDLGLVKGDFSQFRKADIVLTPTEAVQISPMLMACGFPWGASGICYPIGKLSVYYEYFTTQGLLYPGMSGGPVIDRLTNRVIAVNSAVGQGYIVIAGLTGLFEQLGVKVITK
jgi:hypothetical protein